MCVSELVVSELVIELVAKVADGMVLDEVKQQQQLVLRNAKQMMREKRARSSSSSSSSSSSTSSSSASSSSSSSSSSSRSRRRQRHKERKRKLGKYITKKINIAVERVFADVFRRSAELKSCVAESEQTKPIKSKKLSNARREREDWYRRWRELSSDQKTKEKEKRKAEIEKRRVEEAQRTLASAATRTMNAPGTTPAKAVDDWDDTDVYRPSNRTITYNNTTNFYQSARETTPRKFFQSRRF